MSVNVIIERISASLNAGALPIRQADVQVGPLDMADMVRPYAEIFPGVPTSIESPEIFGWGSGSLKKPHHLVPSPRRSCLPLAAPRYSSAPICVPGAGIFHSMLGVWEWYQAKGLAKPELLDGPFAAEELEAFLEPLVDGLSDYWPLAVHLEQAGCDSVEDLIGLPLLLPHTSYDEEHVGVVEALLSGVDSIASMLTEFLSYDSFFDLPEEDLAIIKSAGFVKLVQCYADFKGEKTCDILKLENFGTTFFGQLWQQFPEWEIERLPIISGDGGRDAEIIIKGPDTIEFCLAYAEAYEQMMGAMPYPFDFEANEDRAVDHFVHELCEVWRKGRRMSSVPLGAGMKNVFKDYFAKEGNRVQTA